MDADRIRQAVETHECAMLQDDGKAEHQADMPDCEVCLVDAAARAHADCLDGPTDGAFLVEPEDGFWPTWACDALTELFKERGIYPESGPRRQGFVGAEEVLDRLEAVFQARKEADRG